MRERAIVFRHRHASLYMHSSPALTLRGVRFYFGIREFKPVRITYYCLRNTVDVIVRSSTGGPTLGRSIQTERADLAIITMTGSVLLSCWQKTHRHNHEQVIPSSVT